jgi:hypothetical protein
VQSGGKEVVSAELGYKEGRLCSLLGKHPGWDQELYVKQMREFKEGVLETIRTAESGPTGAAFLFDVHGNANIVAFGGGVPVPDGKGGVRIAADPSTCLSADDISRALVERRRNYPNDPEPVVIFTSWVSGDTAMTVIDRATGKGAPCIIFALTEHQQLGQSDGLSSLGNKFWPYLLMPEQAESLPAALIARGDIGVHTYEWQPEHFKSSPTVGDSLKILCRTPLAPGSNPMIFLPREPDKRADGEPGSCKPVSSPFPAPNTYN